MKRAIIIVLFGCSRIIDRLAPESVPPPAPTLPVLSVPAVVVANATQQAAAVVSPDPAFSYEWSLINGTLRSPSRASSIVFDAGAVGAVTFTVRALNAANTPGPTAFASSNIVAGFPTGYAPAIAVPPSVIAGRSHLLALVDNPLADATYSWSASGAGVLDGATSGTSVLFSMPTAGALTLTVQAQIAGTSSNGVTSSATVNALVATDTLDLFTGTAGGPGLLDGPLSVARFAAAANGHRFSTDAAGKLYIGYIGTNVVRSVDTSGVVQTLAAGFTLGDGTTPGLDALAADSKGNVYIADYASCRVLILAADTGAASILNGGPPPGNCGSLQTDSGDHIANAVLASPTNVAVDSNDNLYVATAQHLLRFAASDGAMQVIVSPAYPNPCADSTTLGAATGERYWQLSAVGTTIYWNDGNALRSFDGVATVSSISGSCSAAIYSGAPFGVVAQPPNFFEYGLDSTFGNYILTSYAAGTLTTLLSGTSMTTPTGPLPLDNSYSSYGQQIAPAGSGHLWLYDDVSGSLIADDTATNMLSVRSTPSLLHVGLVNGPANFARFGSVDAIAVDASDNLYVADNYNGALREIAPDGTVSTLFASGQPESRDGPAAFASISSATSLLAIGDGNLLIADGAVVREWSQTAQKLSLLAGGGSVTLGQGLNTGAGGEVRFGQLEPGPMRLASSPDGTLFLSDQQNIYVMNLVGDVALLWPSADNPDDSGQGINGLAAVSPQLIYATRNNAAVASADNTPPVAAIVRLSGTAPPYALTVVAGGAPSSANANGACASATFLNPSVLHVLPNGDLLVLDNQQLRRISGPETSACSVSTVLGTNAASLRAFVPGARPGAFNNPIDFVVTAAFDYAVLDAGENIVARYRPPEP